MDPSSSWSTSATTHAAYARRQHAAAPHSALEQFGRAVLEQEDAAETLQAVAQYVDAETKLLHPPTKWLTLAEQVQGLVGFGERLATGVETLDKALRGGIPARAVVTVGGAPGAGKTTWAVQQAVQWAARGVHVAIYAADEAATGLLVRVGQQLGFDRDLIERADPTALKPLEERLARLPNLLLVDADEQAATIEDVSAELERRAAGSPSVLVVDSMQTARVVGGDECDGPRARIDLVINVVKHEAKTRKHRIWVTSASSRVVPTAKRNNPQSAPDDLAAFKESGGIEYGVALALVMRSVPGDDAQKQGLVDVAIPKNRIGTQKTPFRLEQSFKTATFREVDAPTKDDVAAKASSDDEKVLALLRSPTYVPLVPRDLRAAVRGVRATGVDAALDRLAERGAIRIETVERRDALKRLRKLHLVVAVEQPAELANDGDSASDALGHNGSRRRSEHARQRVPLLVGADAESLTAAADQTQTGRAIPVQP